MVFLALLEYAILLFSINMTEAKEVEKKKEFLRRAMLAASAQQKNDVDSFAGATNATKDPTELVAEVRETFARSSSPKKLLLSKEAYHIMPYLSLRRFDVIALVLFPVAFTIFNAGYWIHYNNL